MDKRKNVLQGKPTKICQYGEDCYRKNPNHFAEYTHSHLKKIIENGKDTQTNQYKIPDELYSSRSIIVEQIAIMENLFPPTSTNTQCKRPKLDSPSAAVPTASKKEDEKIEVINLAEDTKKTEVRKNNITADQLKASLEKTMNNVKITAEGENHYSREQIAPKQTTTNHQKPSTSRSTDQNEVAVLQNKKPMNIHDYITVVNPRGQMSKKLEAAAPYHFFLTTITSSPATYSEPLSITMQEILDTSLGEIESTVQINFMIDIGWLLGHYYFAGCLNKPLLVLYGDETPDLKNISTKKPQVTAIKVQMSSPFGTHHTKMMLIGYKDGSMRVIVSTANLVEDDWHNRTQGIWVGPKCEPLPENADTTTGESPTGFREDLVRYLVSYNLPKLQPWIARIRKTSFKDVNVFLVTSVPGGHRDTPKGYHFGHAKVSSILSKHCAPVPDASPVIAQSSSIGSLGPNEQSWIGADIINSFRRDCQPIGIRRVPAFKMIYPSFSNVKNSHDDLLGGGGLPYRKAINDKQPWLRNHLHQWKSSKRYRSQAMPHIKTYCRWTNEDGLFWFLLTSANLSKAAWGAFNKGSKLDLPLRIMNYEAGVLFLPKFIMKNGGTTFPMQNSKNGCPSFPMPYDVPLTPYCQDDTPFFMDYLLQ